MTDLYWITVVGNLHDVAKFMALICLVGLIIFGIFYYVAVQDENEDSERKLNKYFKLFLVTLIITGISYTFIPKTSDMYMIYGVGNTMDYLKNNDAAKQLPDKTIKALDKWLDSISKDEEEQ